MKGLIGGSNPPPRIFFHDFLSLKSKLIIRKREVLMKTLFFGAGPIGRLYAYLFYKAGMAMLRPNCPDWQLQICSERCTQSAMKCLFVKDE